MNKQNQAIEKTKELVYAQVKKTPTKLKDLDRGGYPNLYIQRALFELANEKRVEINMYAETVQLPR